MLLPDLSLGSDNQGHLRHNLPLKKVYLFKHYSGCDSIVYAYTSDVILGFCTEILFGVPHTKRNGGATHTALHVHVHPPGS